MDWVNFSVTDKGAGTYDHSADIYWRGRICCISVVFFANPISTKPMVSVPKLKDRKTGIFGFHCLNVMVKLFVFLVCVFITVFTVIPSALQIRIVKKRLLPY